MLATLAGCKGEHKLSKDIYVYVFTQDYEAERVGTYGRYTFHERTCVPENKMYSGDTAIVHVRYGEEFVPYHVPMSVLRLLSPEEYQATKAGHRDSPHYLGRKLEELFQVKNVMSLSDGSTPAKTAKNVDSLLWYLLIPALLLWIVGLLCRGSDGSVLLPVIGLVLMIAQLVMLAVIVLPNGLYIRDIGDFLVVAFIPFSAVMVTNVYAGFKMHGCLLGHYEIKDAFRPMVESLAIGIVVFFLPNLVIRAIFSEQMKDPVNVFLLGVGCFLLACASAFCWYVYKLKRQNPAILKVAPLLGAIIFFTLLFGSVLIVVIFVFIIARFTLSLATSAGQPDGNLLGGPTPRTCEHCRHCHLGVCFMGNVVTTSANSCSHFEYDE